MSDSPERRVCTVGEETSGNAALQRALVKLKLPIVSSPSGEEYLSDDQQETIFVLDKFEGATYELLMKSEQRIIGPPVVFKCAENGESLPFNARPLYCQLMSELVICFTGFREKEHISSLVNLVHHMGGSVKPHFSTKITHLVANSTRGSKYRTAVGLGTPIMTQDWIYMAWDKNNDIKASAIDDDMMQFRMLPFFCCCLNFYGFSDDEREHMEELAQTHGGTTSTVLNETCTHLVLEDSTVKEVTFDLPPQVKVVKSEWFWGSIQMDACADENMYLFRGGEEAGTPGTPSATPVTRSRKRRRLKESLALLAAQGDQASSSSSSLYQPLSKRRSSDVTLLSISGSFLDASQTPETASMLGDTPTPRPEAMAAQPASSAPAPPAKSITRRQHEANELRDTEINYVKTLHTIIKVFKDPLLDPEQPGGLMLPKTEVDNIFGNLADIYQLHDRLKEDLVQVMQDYSEQDSRIGQAVLKHSSDMRKVYPIYINFLDKTKDNIEQCEKKYHRFHAFLKIAQSKPECGRQKLVDLMVWPVQRPPRITDLLKGILKRTDTSAKDYMDLKEACQVMKDISSHINEEKRHTETYTKMFDVINGIEGIPPELLSSHRLLIRRVNLVEISDQLHGKGCNFIEKGASITMFLFNDTLEICKRRGAGKMIGKSPAVGVAKTPQRGFKHLEVHSLNNIRRILDITETEDCQNAFALLIRPPMAGAQTEDRLYMFALIEDEESPPNPKQDWLDQLSKQMAETACKADAENFLVKMAPEELELSKSDFDKNRKLGHAISRVARKASKKVGRTFSFNKTPRRVVQRTISSISGNVSPMIAMAAQSISKKLTLTPKNEVMGARLAISANTKAFSPMAHRPPITPKRLKSITIGHSSAKRM